MRILHFDGLVKAEQGIADGQVSPGGCRNEFEVQPDPRITAEHGSSRFAGAKESGCHSEN